MAVQRLVMRTPVLRQQVKSREKQVLLTGHRTRRAFSPVAAAGDNGIDIAVETVFQEQQGGRDREKEDKRVPVVEEKAGQDGVREAFALLWKDVEYLENYTGFELKKKISSMADVHDALVAALNPIAAEEMQQELEEKIAGMQAELAQAHQAVHVSEERLQRTIMRLQELQNRIVSISGGVRGSSDGRADSATSGSKDAESEKGLLSASLDLPVGLKQFWYPVEFTSKLVSNTMIPVELFGESWVLFRDEEGRAACLKDECAHRACPLSVGKMVEGRPSCAYHGWEFNGRGECTKMPSTKFCKGISVRALPVTEIDGLVWIYPGEQESIPPAPAKGATIAPDGFRLHAEISMEVPVDYGLLLENLLDLAHAPFTHTSTFAKGWQVPDIVNIHTADSLGGSWRPYPIDMNFLPPCGVVSLIGLAKPGKVDAGSTAAECKNHLHQMHMCIPTREGHTKLLYRMSLDFMGWVRFIPGIQKFWKYIASQVLGEDLTLVEGQQHRLEAGSELWQNPVPYDQLGVRYRRWRNKVSSKRDISFEK